MLPPDFDSDAIARAAQDILDDTRFTAHATHMAEAMRGYGGAPRAATALESLA